MGDGGLRGLPLWLLSPNRVRRPAQPVLRYLLALALAWMVAVEGAKAHLDEDEVTHKDLWPLDWTDAVTIILMMLGLVVASTAGQGGGGILVSLYMIAAGFETRQAIALSPVTVLGSALANVIMASFKRHPYADRPLIEWNLVIILEPMAMVGSVLGVFLHRVLPPVVLIITLIVIFTWMTLRTTRKGLDLLEKEGGWRKLLDNKAVVPADGSNGVIVNGSEREGQAYAQIAEDKHLLSANGGRSHVYESLAPCNYTVPISSPRVNPLAVQEVLARERRVMYWKPAFITIAFLGVVSCNLAKRAVPCGTLPYWAIALAPIPWTVPFYLFARGYLKRDYKYKQAIGYHFVYGDTHWSRKNTDKWPFLTIFAGLMAGMFGLGGGTVKAPLMLEMGVFPAVCKATIAVMILYTSASATTMFAAFNVIPWDYGVFFFCVGFVCPFIGHAIVSRIPAMQRHQSPVVLATVLIIMLSTIGLSYEAVLRLVESPCNAFTVGTVCARRGL